MKGAKMANAASHKAHEGMSPIQLEKSDRRVNYRVASEGDKACGDCRFFCQAGMHCMLVEGTIDPEWTCNMYTKPLSSAPSSDYSHYGYSETQAPFHAFVDISRVFKDDTDFTTPMWIPFLPKPGSYAHPRYGTVEITKELNESFTKGVKDHVYQEKIPLDAEHETKLSGAVGWFSDMRVNEDGSADAFVEWTDRGVSLLGQGNFKYISPEWYDTWREPASGDVLDNVIIGGAITTRPFFKDKVMRALVASEDGGELIAPDSEGDRKVAGENKDKDQTITMTEAALDEKIAAAAKRASEEAVAVAENKFAEQLKERDAKITAAESLAATEKEAREAATGQLAVMQADARDRRFKDLIAGKGGANDGAPWIGDAESHLTVLKGMSEAGIAEDSATFTKFVEGQNAIAAQAKESNLFSVVGSSASGGDGASPEAKIEALAKAAHEKDPSKTYQQHYAEVARSPEGRKLYSEMPAPKASR